MRLVAVLIFCATLLAGTIVADAEQQSEQHEAVPSSFDGAGAAFKSGGREVGAGFRAIGLGLRDTFTGRRAADDYRDGKKIGTGFKDLGRGIAGGARAMGRAIKNSVNQGGN